MGAPKKTRVDVTPEQKKELQRSMQRCWQYIAHDILRNMQEMGEEPIMAKDDVIDVVIDQMDSNGEMNKETRALWNVLPFEQMQEIAGETFQFQRYGM